MSDSCGVDPSAGNVLLPANAAGCELSSKPGLALMCEVSRLALSALARKITKGPFTLVRWCLQPLALNCVTSPANHSVQQMD